MVSAQVIGHISVAGENSLPHTERKPDMQADLSTVLVPATSVTLTLSPGEAEALLPAINDLFLASDRYSGATKDAVDALWTTAVEGATALSYI